MRIAITGATSSIGIALVKKIISEGDEIVAFVRRKSKNVSKLPESDMITLVDFDLTDSKTFDVENMDKCDVFYHFAWLYTEKINRNDYLKQSENIALTIKTVEMANKLGCGKYIGAGSQAEYGFQNILINEESDTRPDTAYGMAKLAAGRMVQALCKQYNMDYVWGRIFSVYGMNDLPGTVINYGLTKYRNGEPAEFSAGTHLWNFLYDEDAAEFFYRLGVNNVENGIYCVASNDTRPLREFLIEMTSEYGKDAICRFSDSMKEETHGGINPNIDKIIRETNYTPKTGFREGIARIIEKKYS